MQPVTRQLAASPARGADQRARQDAQRSAHMPRTPQRFAREVLSELPIERVPDSALHAQQRRANPFDPRTTLAGLGVTSTSPRRLPTPAVKARTPQPRVGTADSPTGPRPHSVQLVRSPPGPSVTRRLLQSKPTERRGRSPPSPLHPGVSFDDGDEFLPPPPSPHRVAGSSADFEAQGRTIPLASYLGGSSSAVVVSTSDHAATDGFRPLSPELALSFERRPASRATVVDRTLLFSRERLHAEDRKALRSRAKTPLEIERWHDTLELTRVQEVIRGRKKAPPAEQMQQRIADRAARIVAAHLSDSGVRFQQPAQSWTELVAALDTIDARAEEELERAKKAKAARAQAERRRNPHSIVRTVIAARTAITGPSTSSGTGAGDSGGSPADALALPVVKKGRKRKSILALPSKPGQGQHGTSGPRFAPHEAIGILNNWALIDDIGIGSANIRDVRQWCRDVLGRPIDEVLAAKILDTQSGVVTLESFCALVRPDVSAADARVSLDLILAAKPKQQKQRPQQAQKKAPAGTAHLTQRQHEQERQQTVRVVTYPVKDAPPLVDRRVWMRTADPGAVKTLRDLFVRQRDGPRGVSRKAYLHRHRRLLARKDLADGFDTADIDGDGWLCFEEFSRLLWGGVCPGTPFPVAVADVLHAIVGGGSSGGVSPTQPDASEGGFEVLDPQAPTSGAFDDSGL